MDKFCKLHLKKWLWECVECKNTYCEDCMAQIIECKNKHHNLVSYIHNSNEERTKEPAKEFKKESNELINLTEEIELNFKNLRNDIISIAIEETKIFKEIKEKFFKLFAFFKINNQKSISLIEKRIKNIRLQLLIINRQIIRKPKIMETEVETEALKGLKNSKLIELFQRTMITPDIFQIPILKIEENYLWSDPEKFFGSILPIKIKIPTFFKKNKCKYYLNSLFNSVYTKYFEDFKNLKLGNGFNITFYFETKSKIICVRRIQNYINLLKITQKEICEHLNKYENNHIYIFKRLKLVDAFKERIKLFELRNKGNISILIQIINRISRRRIILFTNILSKVLMTLLIKSKKSIPTGIFRDNIYRQCTKNLSFERKKVDSPFLFYLKWNSPMEIYLENLISKNSKKFTLYNQAFMNDIEQHENYIFSCGGYEGGALAKSWSLALSNLQKSQGNPIPDIINSRYYAALISTPFDLFVLGGFHQRNRFLKSCERFNNKSLWKQIPDLNTASSMLTATFVYPAHIYVLGGSFSESYEKLQIKNPLESSWEPLNINSNKISRCYGCIVQLNASEFLLFGGGDCPINGFEVYNICNNTIDNTGKPFNTYHYSGSKLRIIGETVKVISYNYGKIIFIKSLKLLNFEEIDLEI